MNLKDKVFQASALRLPSGLWRLKRRPYFSRLSQERSLPWGSKETEEDSIFHHDVIREAGILLEKPIAKGSFSTVWKARWPSFGLALGVKIYDKMTRKGSQALRTVQNELAVLKLVKHPHLTRCFGAWETEFRFYIALEYLPTGNLLEFLKLNGAVDEHQAKLWFAQILSGVKFLHDLRIAHRDIKCENILLDMNGALRVTDFGFATMEIPWDASIPNSDWRKFTDFCGSQAYFSPEILMKVPYSPLLSDVWAMGVVLYAMLFGVFPFEAVEDPSIARELPTAWSTPHDKEVSNECLSVIRRIFMLERRRARSYELLQSDWLNQLPMVLQLKETLLLAEKAGKTLKEIEEEANVTDQTQHENFWGTAHPILAKSRKNCYAI